VTPLVIPFIFSWSVIKDIHSWKSSLVKRSKLCGAVVQDGQNRSVLFWLNQNSFKSVSKLFCLSFISTCRQLCWTVCVHRVFSAEKHQRKRSSHSGSIILSISRKRLRCTCVSDAGGSKSRGRERAEKGETWTMLRRVNRDRQHCCALQWKEPN